MIMNKTRQAVELIPWLMSGDPAIAYQCQRDLLCQQDRAAQQRIASEGWGAEILSCQNADTSWGDRFYQPKWISTHYTLLDLCQLGLPPDNPQAQAAVSYILRTEVQPDGGVGPGTTIKASDVCVAGMFLNYACYFMAAAEGLKSIVDFLLNQHMADGGFNCQLNRSGAHHSSMHSTLSVLEGIERYRQCGYDYRLHDLNQCAEQGREFLLQHHLYKSDRTGDVIRKDFTRLVFPARWKFNVLRAMDYFQASATPWDDRMQDALGLILSKRKPEGYWLAAAAHPGQVHMVMEIPRHPSRWITLLALRTLKAYSPDTMRQDL